MLVASEQDWNLSIPNDTWRCLYAVKWEKGKMSLEIPLEGVNIAFFATFVA